MILKSSLYQNPPEGVLTNRFLPPPLEFLILQIWDGAQESIFQTSSQSYWCWGDRDICYLLMITWVARDNILIVRLNSVTLVNILLPNKVTLTGPRDWIAGIHCRKARFSAYHGDPGLPWFYPGSQRESLPQFHINRDWSICPLDFCVLPTKSDQLLPFAWDSGVPCWKSCLSGYFLVAGK